MTAEECDISVLQCPSWPNEFQRLALDSGTPRCVLLQHLTVTVFHQSQWNCHITVTPQCTEQQ
jgi:hypothetical protein